MATLIHKPAPPKPPLEERLVVWAFILTLASVPVAQLVSEARQGEGFQCLEVFRAAPTLEHFQAFEKALEDACVVAKVVRPWIQYASTKWLRRGNEKVIVGRGGWLFYRPSFNHVVGPAITADDGEGTPLRAITAYQRALAERGIDLAVMIVPMKESWHAAHLWPGAAPTRNRGTARLIEALRQRGVEVWDLWEAFQLTRQAGASRSGYLPEDTHWQPGLLDIAAAVGAAPDGLRRQFHRLPERTVRNRGDLFDMLALPADRPLSEPFEVALSQVVDEFGEPWRPDPEGPVLLLGDSFTNIYSDPSLNWGEGAGLAEQLSYHLGVGVDVIAQNDGGVNGTRAALARQPRKLRGKRLVIWQFAERDLSNKAGEWQVIPLPEEAR